MKIKIDISDVLSFFNLSKADSDFIIQASVDAVSAEVHRNWVNQAKKELSSTRANYINSVIHEKMSPKINVIRLDVRDRMSNMLEFGFGAFDLKQYLLKSTRIKRTQEGEPYIDVAFRFATPKASGFSSGFSGVMPNDVYNAVSKMRPFKTDSSGSIIQRGGRYNTNNPAYRTTRFAVTNLKTRDSFSEYISQYSIYEGMRRYQKDYNKTSSSTYFTFRRISFNSEDSSWVHKGVNAFDLASKAIKATNVQTIVDNAVDISLNKLGL